MLEGLQAETADGSKSSGKFSIPSGPHGVGAIFYHRQIVPLGNNHQFIHVTDMAAHMRQK
jgi:hypothetical protein